MKEQFYRAVIVCFILFLAGSPIAFYGAKKQSFLLASIGIVLLILAWYMFYVSIFTSQV